MIEPHDSPAEEPLKPIQIVAVIVLYRILPTASTSYCSLVAAVGNLDRKVCHFRIVLWDNSPREQDVSGLIENVQYISDHRNLGLSNAYNRVLEIAIKQGCDWLITLDQDTVLPGDFLTNLCQRASRTGKDGTTDAIVPQIIAYGRRLSPYYFQGGAIVRWYPSGYVGVSKRRTFAFNSGTMIRVSALEQIGGYDPWFWLDNSDTRMFQRLHMHGKRIYIAGDIQAGHNFSMKHMNDGMTRARYQNALLAESAFWDLEMNWLAGCERTLRLALRLIKHLMRRDSPELQRVTRKFLWMRLFHTKKYRIQKWKAATVKHLGKAFESTALPQRALKVSVCMAAYNGGRFIDIQLKSILPQLGQQDEVVIIDDCSTDNTVERIREVNDERIRLIQHPVNQGVVATFEHALRSATGDILFLSDDDDIWAPNKVARFLEVFEAAPEVQIVTSRVQLIDDAGTPFTNDKMTRNGKFFPGFWRNIYKNHYQGSAMAIRASFLGRVLPFPVRPAFLHDVWIGTRSELTGDRTVFIEEDLLFYRRHAGNVSRQLSHWKQLRWRAELLWAHVLFAFR